MKLMWILINDAFLQLELKIRKNENIMIHRHTSYIVQWQTMVMTSRGHSEKKNSTH